MIVTWFNQRGRVWLSKCRCSSTPPSTIAGCVISESNEPALFNRLLQQLENPCQRRFWRRIQWQTFKTSRTLRSAVHEHVYLIGREALINAFRHADAKNIEVELEYAPRRLRVAVSRRWSRHRQIRPRPCCVWRREIICGLDPKLSQRRRNAFRRFILPDSAPFVADFGEGIFHFARVGAIDASIG